MKDARVELGPELKAAISKGSAERNGNGHPSNSTLTPFTEIIAKPVRFLWRDRIALGKITALAGRPKIGKGLLYSRLIADVTNGRLEGDLTAPARAIIVTTEDEPGDTLKPRLMAAGADLSRVTMFQMGSKDEPVPFRVPQDADELGRRVEGTGALLVVIDPLMEFLDGKTDSHKSQSSRHAVSAVNEIARRTGCAVLTIFHLNKGVSTDPLLRHEGSAAFTQIVRSGLMLGFDPDDPEGEEGDQRVLAVSSSNLAKLAPSLAYRIEGASVTGDTNEEIATAAMHYQGESSAASHELLRGREDNEDRVDRDEATEFLLAELGDEPISAKEIGRRAKDAGIGPNALKRAKRELRVHSAKPKFSGGWEWSLPEAGGASPSGHAAGEPSPSSPSSPSPSRAKSEHPLRGQITEGDEGDALTDGNLFAATEAEEAEAERLADKFGAAP
jgi:putative DNA primase/helicase